MRYHGLAAGVAVWLLAGCSSGTPEGQVVATVNGSEISSAALQAEARAAGLPPAALESGPAREQILQRVIDRRLLVQRAEADKLDQSPDYLADQERTRELLLAQRAAAKLMAETAPPAAPTMAAVAKLIQSGKGQLGDRAVYLADLVRFPAEGGNVDLGWLDPLESMDLVEETLKRRAVQYTRSSQPIDAAQLPPALRTQLDKAPNGKLFYFRNGDVVVVLSIKDRADVPVPGFVQETLARDTLARGAQEGRMAAMLKALRTGAKLEYQPGYAPGSSAKTKPAAK